MRDVEDMVRAIRDAAYLNRCPPLRVFVSSTFVDLREERKAVKHAISLCNCTARLAEDAEMRPGMNLTEQIKYWLRDINVLVLLVAERYGELSPSQVSWTQEEVQIASTQPIRIFPYFVKREIPNGLELDENKRQNLMAFKKFLEGLPGQKPVLAQYPQYPENITDLVIRVARDIGSSQADCLVDHIVNRVVYELENEDKNQKDRYDDSFVS